MTIEEYLREYKALTLDIMEQINIDGNIGYLLDERESILEQINQLQVSKEEIKKYCSLLNIINIDKEMNSMVKMEIASIKNKLNNLKRRRQGNTQYAYALQAKYNHTTFDRYIH